MERPIPIDPRNDSDYDTWEVGMEPIPGDQSWKHKDNDKQDQEP